MRVEILIANHVEPLPEVKFISHPFCIEIVRLIVTLPVGLVQKLSPLKGGWRFHIAKSAQVKMFAGVLQEFSPS